MHRATRRGFTLVEVLVSLAIFAVAAVVLGAAYVNVLTNYQAAMKWDAETGVADLLRAAVQAEPDRVRVERGGEQPLSDNSVVRWRARVDDTTTADLFAVTLEWDVDQPGHGPPVAGRQSFMLLRPTWSDAEARERLRTITRQRLARRKF